MAVFAVRMLGNALQVNVSALLHSRVTGWPREPRPILLPAQHWEHKHAPPPTLAVFIQELERKLWLSGFRAVCQLTHLPHPGVCYPSCY